jgi:hypothetical protein
LEVNEDLDEVQWQLYYHLGQHAVQKNLNFFPNIKLKSTTTQETENIIKSLKPKNTYGYDEIPTNLLKLTWCILIHL